MVVTRPAENLQLRGEVIRGLQDNLLHGGHSLSMIPDTIATIIDEGMWKEWVVPVTGEIKKYKSFAAFAKAPMPEGLKIDRSSLLDLCHGHADVQKKLKKAWPMEGDELREHRRPTKEERGTKGSNATFSNDRGATYAEARIARDRPDLYERVLSQELSPHAAMVEAGFRPRTATFCPDDIKRTARVLLKHFDKEELIQALKEV